MAKVQMHDFLAELFPNADLSTPARTALSVTRHADDTRTLAHRDTALGHYERVRARWGAPPHWRGVTPAGRLVSATDEPGVRAALIEAAL